MEIRRNPPAEQVNWQSVEAVRTREVAARVCLEKDAKGRWKAAGDFSRCSEEEVAAAGCKCLRIPKSVGRPRLIRCLPSPLSFISRTRAMEKKENGKSAAKSARELTRFTNGLPNRSRAFERLKEKRMKAKLNRKMIFPSNG